MMLETLRRIVQDVSAARDLSTALSLIVRRVRKAMGTDVCSVYLYNPERERYVLMDTLGLNPAAIGRVSLALNQGLVGYVGQREEPVNLDNAPEHPNYLYLRVTGEERYHSFLGVPIIHQRRVLGVLVVQQKAKRRFDEGEEAFLVTIAAQLAAVLAHAIANGSLSLDRAGQRKSVPYNGVSASPGIAIGEAVVVMPPADLDAVPDRQCEDAEAEKALFDQALMAVREDIEALSARLAKRISPQEQLLFEAYLQMLDEAALGGEVHKRIDDGHWAQGALSHVVRRHVKYLEKVEDAYLRERAADIRDLGRRVLAYLQARSDIRQDYPENTILVGEELSPALLGEVPREHLVGLVSVRGSSNSHLAILARAMGIPTVMGLSDLPYKRLESESLVVDGYHGQVICWPDEILSAQYREHMRQDEALTEELEVEARKLCETLDGHRVPLLVNTGLVEDQSRAQALGAEGVGLYRTEVPFMMAERFPGEQEQTRIYREQLVAFAPFPVVMRTLDIGGDKPLPYFPIEERNPALGWRGIRVTLDHPEVFMAQIRAMLRASDGLENLRILLPMVASMHEVDEARKMVMRAHEELQSNEGLKLPMPRIGAMIEVPSMIFQVGALSKRVDFLSVGSNDLTQYLLAVDRDNPRVAGLYNAMHPAVLRALNDLALKARKYQLPVSLCGELAGDPAGALLLMAMGYQGLSMNLSSLPRVKAAIRRVTLAQAKQLLVAVLPCETTQEVEDAVAAFSREHDLEWLIVMRRKA
ncbi:phosphoenolpyruvate--protein phosphotransferase [Terasakiispira papahanaumokuakeensis]|uniref:phosphoenolpyruvate--protein phosphotransferase n=2 Tax=Terasakiispira papahanaumokuakeensis TaxID=197479 RepID=A0A1E2V6C5_9GAMM|nr:phosphoenolpyruvate--protein phosphotransferase [Terasakiispira papahanaumokuakeensis]